MAHLLSPPRTLSDLVPSSASNESETTTSKRITSLKSRLELSKANLIKQSNNTEDSTSATSLIFHFFPHLPFELRVKIFHAALTTQEIFAVGWDPEYNSPFLGRRMRCRSWHNFTVQAALHTEKSNLLFVNAEARGEAKSILRRFVACGHQTWYNPATDLAWFPRFDDGVDNIVLDNLGFLIDHSLQRMTLPYHLWVRAPGVVFVGQERQFSYDSFCRMDLREIVLHMGDIDVQDPSNRKSTTADSKLSDFIPSDRFKSMDIKNVTWKHIAEDETRKITNWIAELAASKENILQSGKCQSAFLEKICTNAFSDDHGFDPEMVVSFNETIDSMINISVPTISFCLENGTTFPFDERL